MVHFRHRTNFIIAYPSFAVQREVFALSYRPSRPEKGSLTWALALNKYAAVWAHIIHAPHTGVLVPMLRESFFRALLYHKTKQNILGKRLVYGEGRRVDEGAGETDAAGTGVSEGAVVGVGE